MHALISNHFVTISPMHHVEWKALASSNEAYEEGTLSEETVLLETKDEWRITKGALLAATKESMKGSGSKVPGMDHEVSPPDKGSSASICDFSCQPRN